MCRPLFENPARTVPRVKMATPKTKILFLPFRSPRRPATISEVLIASRYEVCTQAVDEMSIPKEEDIDGKAMFTTLLSKGVVKALAEVIRSTIHLYDCCSVGCVKVLNSHEASQEERVSWCDQNWKGLCDHSWNSLSSEQLLLAEASGCPRNWLSFSGG